MSFEKWKNYNWGEIATLEYGKALTGYKENKKGKGYPVFGTNGPIGFYDKYLSDKPGVIIGRKGAYRGVHYSESPFFVIDTAYYLNPTIPELDLKWAYYNLKLTDINRLDSGSAIPSTSRSDFYSLEVKLPPLFIQQKIASILSALDDKIELNNRMNKVLEQMAQAIFKQWFVDFEFPNENGEPYKSSGGEMEWCEELGKEIPKGWRIGTIGEIVKIVRGASPRPIQEYLSDKGMPWLKISDATASASKYVINTNEFIKEEGISKSRIVTPGTLILSNSATPGIPKIMLIEACVHDGWLIFDNYNGITKELLYYFLLHNREEILSLSNGSVFRNLKTDILKNYKIIIPNDVVIKKSTSFFENANEVIKNRMLENESLMSLRDTLLPKLMSGEIDVSEIEL